MAEEVAATAAAVAVHYDAVINASYHLLAHDSFDSFLQFVSPAVTRLLQLLPPLLSQESEYLVLKLVYAFVALFVMLMEYDSGPYYESSEVVVVDQILKMEGKQDV